MIKRLLFILTAIFIFSFVLINPSSANGERVYNCALPLNEQAWIIERLTDSDQSNDSITNEERQAYSRQCDAQTLSNVQETVVNIVYILWIAGVPIFSFAFLFVFYQYMTSRGEPQAFADMMRKLGMLIVALILFVGTHPLATATMRLMIDETSIACYAGLGTPGFRIFFSNVCTNDTVYTVDSCNQLNNNGKDACIVACGRFRNAEGALQCSFAGGPTVCNLPLSNYIFNDRDYLNLSPNNTNVTFYQSRFECRCPETPNLTGIQLSNAVFCVDVEPVDGVKLYR